jgi:hypothetical protein
MVAVPPRVVRANGRRDRWVIEATDVVKLVADDVALEFKLMRVVDVLPLASAALAEVDARGLDALRGRVEYFDDAAEEHAGALAVEFSDDGFAGDAVIEEEGAAVVVRDRTALVRNIAEGNGDSFGRIDAVFAGFSSHLKGLAFSV